MFDALVNGRIDCGELTFEVAYYDIEELNRRAEAGETDVSKISYALLPEIQSRYTLLDSGSALGRGNGPVFVARQGTPPDSIRRVAVPGMHTTANALMSRLYPSITQKKPVLFSEIAPAVARGEYDAGVLIHEGRFVYRKLGLELVADLGELWESRTGLPLPLGAIVARRTLPEELRCEIERLLRTSIEYAFAHREESRTYIKEHARELDDRVIDHHIDFFVNSYSLSLGDEGRRAVRELTGVEVGAAIALVVNALAVEHLRTAQSVQLRHAFESQHINNDTRHHVGDRRTALYINNRFTFDDFMNTFSAGRIRVRRLHATGGSAVAPSDDRFSSCGS